MSFGEMPVRENVIRGTFRCANVRLGELSVRGSVFRGTVLRGTVRRGNVFGELLVRKKFIGEMSVKLNKCILFEVLLYSFTQNNEYIVTPYEQGYFNYLFLSIIFYAFCYVILHYMVFVSSRYII